MLYSSVGETIVSQLIILSFMGIPKYLNLTLWPDSLALGINKIKHVLLLIRAIAKCERYLYDKCICWFFMPQDMLLQVVHTAMACLTVWQLCCWVTWDLMNVCNGLHLPTSYPTNVWLKKPKSHLVVKSVS